jgi:hypothetical protein
MSLRPLVVTTSQYRRRKGRSVHHRSSTSHDSRTASISRPSTTCGLPPSPASTATRTGTDRRRGPLIPRTESAPPGARETENRDRPQGCAARHLDRPPRASGGSPPGASPPAPRRDRQAAVADRSPAAQSAQQRAAATRRAQGQAPAGERAPDASAPDRQVPPGIRPAPATSRPARRGPPRGSPTEVSGHVAHAAPADDRSKGQGHVRAAFPTSPPEARATPGGTPPPAGDGALRHRPSQAHGRAVPGDRTDPPAHPAEPPPVHRVSGRPTVRAPLEGPIGRSGPAARQLAEEPDRHVPERERDRDRDQRGSHQPLPRPPAGAPLLVWRRRRPRTATARSRSVPEFATRVGWPKVRRRALGAIASDPRRRNRRGPVVQARPPPRSTQGARAAAPKRRRPRLGPVGQASAVDSAPAPPPPASRHEHRTPPPQATPLPPSAPHRAREPALPASAGARNDRQRRPSTRTWGAERR